MISCPVGKTLSHPKSLKEVPRHKPQSKFQILGLVSFDYESGRVTNAKDFLFNVYYTPFMQEFNVE